MAEEKPLDGFRKEVINLTSELVMKALEEVCRSQEEDRDPPSGGGSRHDAGKLEVSL